MYKEILYEVDDALATVTLNRPDRLNAVTKQLDGELRQAVAEADADPSVSVIVLTGAGRGFCAGADMDLLARPPRKPKSGAKKEREGDFASEPYFARVRKPIIAAVNGPCAGIGLAYALACDLRFASDRVVFTSAFARRGLIAEYGMAWLLPRLVGTGHALDLLLSARRVEAAEAERIGLVNRVVPHDELLKSVREYAADVAQSCAPNSLQIIRNQVYSGLTESFDVSFAKGMQLMEESVHHPDAPEGAKSYLEKRPPRFARLP